MEPLAEFNALAASCSTNHLVLDLAAYCAAVRDGTPIPVFVRLNKYDMPDQRGPGLINSSRLRHLLMSPLSPEFYEVAHGVDALIVRDLRRRLNPAPAPVASTSPA